MDVFIFALGGLSLVVAVLLCGAYFANRIHARWEKEIDQSHKQLEKSILEYIHSKEKFVVEREQYNTQLKTKEEEL